MLIVEWDKVNEEDYVEESDLDEKIRCICLDNDDSKVVKELDKLFEKHPEKKYLGFAFEYILESGKESLVDYILEKGVDPSHSNDSPLQCCCIGSDLDTFKKILNAGAELTKENSWLLKDADYYRNHEIAKYIANELLSKKIMTVEEIRALFSDDAKYLEPIYKKHILLREPEKEINNTIEDCSL